MTSSCLSRFLGLGGAIVLLAGCGSVGPTPYQLYVLQPSAPPAANFAALPEMQSNLVIDMPDAPSSLDTVRIALGKNSTSMDYFAGASWSDRLPALLQSKLVEAFEASHKVKSVSRESTGLHSDYMLRPDIRNFEAQYSQPDAAPQVVVHISFKLVKLPEREVVGSFNAEQSAQAQENKIESIVTAFDQALGAAIQQTVEWTLKTQTPPEPPKPHHWHKKPPPAAPAATPPATPQK